MPMKKKRFCLDVAKTMPAMAHHKGGVPFDVNSSDVIAWLCAQPRIRQYLFDTCRGNGLIVFDQASGTWSGADYKPKFEF